MIYTEQGKAVRKASVEALADFLSSQLWAGRIFATVMLAEDLLDAIAAGKIPNVEITDKETV